MSKKIAVLGAGPMGLAVAYQLVKDGHQPLVFEADDRIGGMTASFDFSGLPIERYYHFHCISDYAFLSLLEELGISEKMNWVPTKMGFWYKNRLQAWGNPIALFKFKGLGLMPKIRYGLHAFFCTKRNHWNDLDKMSAVEWIRNSIGKDAYDALWRKLFEYKFYDYSSNLSAAWIWSRIRRIGRSRYSIFQEKLGYLDGGSETLLKAMQTYIESNGGKILLEHPASEVMVESGKVVGLKTEHEKYRFDCVISTIPLPYVAKIMPSLPSEILEQYNSVKNIAVVCVIVKLKRQISENFWLNINDDEMDIPGLVEYSNLRPLDQHIVYVPFYLPADNPKFSESDEVFLCKVRKYLKKINPEIVEEDFIDLRVSRYRFAQPICQPGFLESIPGAKLPIDGLWAADTSHYYPEDRGISESIGFGRALASAALA